MHNIVIVAYQKTKLYIYIEFISTYYNI